MRVTLKQIAELANVSRGTVDRVINDKPGVRDEVRKRVKEIAEELDYRPNIFAKRLSNINKIYKIGVILAPDYNPFVDEIKRGIQSANNELKNFGVEIDVEVMKRLDAGEQLEILDHFIDEKVAGISMVPIYDNVIKEKVNSIIGNDIPVVFFNSDLEGTNRLCFVGQDHLKGGRVAAGLLGKVLRGNGKVALITSSLNLLCHEMRIKGFVDKIKGCYPQIEVVSITENEDKDDEAFYITLKYLESIKKLKGIYITGGGVGGLGKALKVKKMMNKINVVCHDFVPGTILLLKEGVVDYAIGQDPYNQGYMPIKILFDYILANKKPAKNFMELNIDIRTEDNIDL